MPEILDYSDIQFIFMKPGVDGQGFPSKVYTVMACGRPLLICSGENTPIVNFLNGLGCAMIVTSADRRAEVMADWLSSVSREELRRMGGAVVGLIQEKYSKEVVTGKYVELVEELLK